MAGLYADVPDRRMPYDRDGSSGFGFPDGTLHALSALDLALMNSESDGFDFYNITGGTMPVGVLFPEPRDVAAFWVRRRIVSSPTSTVQTSVDTTNGQNGTWVDHGAYDASTAVRPNYRTEIQSASFTGIRAIRFNVNPNEENTRHLHNLHLYGSTVEIVAVWHPTSDVEVPAAWFDFAEVSQGETYVRTFRVKNTDATRTATSIVVGTDVLTDGTTPLGSQFTYSIGGSFSPSLNIGDLAAGAISDEITMHYTVAAGADLGLWSPRVVADPAAVV